MRIALFVTCTVDAFAPAAGRAVVSVLERLGHEIVFPKAQTCCGQMHLNSGYPREATRLARRFVDVFTPYETIVAPSASCVGTVIEGYRNLAEDCGDTRLASEVRALSTRVFEFSSFLVDVLQVTDVGARFEHRVAYHPSCHSLRVLRLADQPQRLLRAVEGLELVEHENAASCCGFGGTFSLKNPDTSAAMLADKLDALAAAGAEVLCSVDNSCLMHLDGGARRRERGLRSVHLAEILAETGDGR